MKTWLIVGDFEDVEVGYTFHPAERPVMYYPDGSGYPGSDAYVEINYVEQNGKDISDYLTEEEWTYLENKVLEDHEEEVDYPEFDDE